MATASSQTLDLSETSSSIIESNAQTPFYSPTRAHSADQLTLVVNTSSKHTKVLGLRSLFVEKVRGVKEFGQRFNKLGRHLSASDQSELAASPRLLSVSSIDPESDVPRLVRTNAIKIKHRNSIYQSPATSPLNSPDQNRRSLLLQDDEPFEKAQDLDSEHSEITDTSFRSTCSFDLLTGGHLQTAESRQVIVNEPICDPQNPVDIIDEQLGLLFDSENAEDDPNHDDPVEAFNHLVECPVFLLNDQPLSTADDTRTSKEDWNGNLLDEVSDLSDFESCKSSLQGDQAENQQLLEESPFFRNRSSSDSIVTMGNKSSSNKTKGRIFNPRPETETPKREPNQSPPAIIQNELVKAASSTSPPSSTSTQEFVDDATKEETVQQQQDLPRFPITIDKSLTSETLFVDVTEEVEDPSSYKDVAHNHTWTCDENVLIPSETSDSINVPDLPLDSNAGTEACSLREVTFSENAASSLSSGLEEQTSDIIDLDADTSPYATELCTKSLELEHLKFKVRSNTLDKRFLPNNQEKAAFLVTLYRKQSAGPDHLGYLSLEVPNLIFQYVASQKFHILKIYLEKQKSASTTTFEIEMPDMIHMSGSSSGHSNGSGRSANTPNGGQPFTLTRHKKVEIPSTSILNHTQNASRPMREPSDLGIPYPSVSAEKESNVLRKVASLTYDLAMEHKQVGSPKMRTLPERQDLSCLENFEGQMLLSNLLSSIDEDHYLRLLISNNDLRLLVSHFVNYLLSIGIICPLEDGSMCEKFMIDRMYRWSRPESVKSPTRPKGEYLSMQEHLMAFQQARQEYDDDLKRLEDQMRFKMKELEEVVSGLTNEIALLKSRPTLEPPPYVPPPCPYATSAPPPPPPPPPPIMGGPPPPPMPSAAPPPPPPPPPMMGGPPPPPPPPMMGGPPPPPPPPPGMGGPPPPPPPPMMGGPPPPPPPPMMGGPPPPPPPPGMGGPPPPPPPPGMGGPPPPPPLAGGPPPPPPGPGGAASPPSLPAPPAGGWNSNKIVIRKNPVDPKQPMKPLYWTRILVPYQAPQQLAPSTISSDSNGTLWDKLEEIEPESWDEFTDLFSRQVVAAKPVKPKAESKPVKQQTVKILDNKRSQMVGILISSRHLDVQVVESAVYNLDTSVIDLETLQKIFELRATDDELATMRLTLEAQPDAILDKPENFLLDLANIPSFSERVACFMFQNNFFENLATISNPLNNLKLTCEKLTSLEVSRVLGIILALGNYMNGGNRQRGQADGFEIDILPKIKNVKSKDNSFTLIFYVVKMYIQKFDDHAGTSDARMPLPEPTDLDKAGHLKFEELEGSLRQLNKEILGVEQKANQVIASSEEIHLEPFKEKMESFFIQAKKSLSEEEENLSECKQRFEAVLKYFKFVPKKNAELDPKIFFEYWSEFASDFKDIWNREQQRIFKENLEKAKKVVKEKKSLKATNSGYTRKKAEEGTLKAKLLNRKKSR